MCYNNKIYYSYMKETIPEIAQQLVKEFDIPLDQALKLAGIEKENELQKKGESPRIASEVKLFSTNVRAAIDDWKKYKHREENVPMNAFSQAA